MPPNSNVNASAMGSGNGGAIDIENGNANYLDVSQATFKSVGAGSGSGGSVIIAQASGADGGAVNVNDQINTNDGNGTGGSPALKIQPRINSVSPEVETLNGVICHRVLVGPNVWPVFYWNCVNPTNPDVTDAYAANFAATLPNSLPAVFSGGHTEIYVFNNAGDYAKFFNFSPGTDPAGFTYLENFLTSSSPLDSSVFEHSNNLTLSEQQIEESIAHELGHALAQITHQDNTDAADVAFAKDQAYLDSAGGGLPCSTAGTAPFDGIIDGTTNLPFCSNGSLANPTKYGSKTNSQIASLSSEILKTVSEVYPQSFAYAVYAKNLS